MNNIIENIKNLKESIDTDKVKLNEEGLIKLLDPASIQDMLLDSYPRLFKIEE